MLRGLFINRKNNALQKGSVKIKTDLLYGRCACIFCWTASFARCAPISTTFGMLIMYAITAGLWIYALFARQIDAFCAAGVGRVLRIGFFCGLGVFCALLAFVAISGYTDQPQGDEKAVVVLGAGLRKDVPSKLLVCRCRRLWNITKKIRTR